MVTFLFALLVSAVGSISFQFTDRESSYWRWYGIRFVTYSVVMIIVNIFWMCPFEFWRIILTLSAMWAVGNLADWFVGRDMYGSHTSKFNSIGAAVTGIFLIGAGLFASCDAPVARDLHKMVNEYNIPAKHFSQKPVDETHIVVVPKKTALRVARQMISKGGKNHGAFYAFEEDTMTIQKVNGRLYWVAPMEFGGFRKQRKTKFSPGFIMISAENPNEKARLVTQKANGTKLRLKYMVHSWLSLNLMRHLYHLYPTRIFLEPTFEIDEQLNPHQVVTVVEPTYMGGRYKVVEVVIVNPETGDIEGHKHRLGSVPQWVDRVIPEELAVDYFKWWGEYKEGWILNNWWDPKEHLKEPTAIGKETSVWMVYGSDQEPYWFTGFTSLSKDDKALIGKAYMNSRTGKFVYLLASGSNEERVVQDVFSALPKLNVPLKACNPIPYNIYGRKNVWVVPVITRPPSKSEGDDESGGDSEGGKLIKIAIIDGDSASPPVIANTKNEVLLLFKRKLGLQGLEVTLSDTSKLKKIKGKIIAITQVVVRGDTQFRFHLKGSPYTFSCDISIADVMTTAIELARTGDEIEVKFEETKERVVPVRKYKVAGQKEVVSDSQRRLNETKRQQAETEKGWKKKPAPESAPAPKSPAALPDRNVP